MSFAIGIVGLPNVGKSTLFKALTKKSVDIANYPFCTIAPNVGVVTVPDVRLNRLAALNQSAKIIPTAIEFVDIAGLVQGAHKGEGLGNQFLSHIRTVDAIAHVVRGFTDPNVIHVSGMVNPAADRETILLELTYADLQTVEKRLREESRQAKGQDQAAVAAVAVLTKLKAHLNAGKLARGLALTPDELAVVKSFHLLTLKPILEVTNVDETQAVQTIPGTVVVCAKIEAELADLEETERAAYLKELGWKESGLDRLVRAAYEALGLVTFFTSGPKETRAWTIQRGACAPVAAGIIHSDFERGFICAEVINWQTLLDAGGEVNAKAKGLIRQEGKGYIVQDGDTMLFRFNV